ncbi:MAG: hypothetical protein DMF68_08100 [Acidobacteria bacterium]|nr:MAG: hypothetical protein DMF68_08100 [Acidobacteriota bacterium]
MTGTSGNTFGGVSAGNTFAGVGAGAAISPRDDFNSDDGVTIHIGQSNSFFGYQAGMLEQDGTDNSFFGTLAGQQNVAGYGNSFFGASAGSSIQQGAYNTMIGANANVLGPNSISNATAIGANAQVSQSNSLVLGDAVNVGIGITEPRGKLDIERATSDGGVILRLGDLGSGTTNFNFSRDGSNGALKIQGNQVGSNNIALVPASGNVGIGTSDPKARLHVAGGNLYVANPNGVIITSPNGACWLLTVSNAGALSSISIPCP